MFQNFLRKLRVIQRAVVVILRIITIISILTRSSDAGEEPIPAM
jgi:hypothetical protein